MLKTRQCLCLIYIDGVIGLSFLLLAFFLLPDGHPVFSGICAAVIFISLQAAGQAASRHLLARIEEDALHRGPTGLLSQFIMRLRFCYSLEDFFDAVAQILEEQADCSVLLIDRDTDYVIYNSPNRLTCKDETMEALKSNFRELRGNALHFFDGDFGLTTDCKSARGFFFVHESFHLYVFCRYARLFDRSIYGRLQDEFVRFLKRQEVIARLSEITELSREWAMLADVQKSFLPMELPEVPGLELASHFQPLVNVSGDYYTVLPLDGHKTLVLLGDVSGKGLSAALVMGLVLNTVKIVDDKEDLSGVVYSIDQAIKGMGLEDKYTVLFIGIIDTQRMTLRYVNASMPEPLIITRSPDGYRIKPLASNCPLVGIIDLDDVVVAEQKLFRGDLILMASDGVSEAMDREGVELGASDRYLGAVRQSASKSVSDFVDDMASLVMSHSGGSLRDDVTMLVARIAG